MSRFLIGLGLGLGVGSILTYSFIQQQQTDFSSFHKEHVSDLPSSPSVVSPHSSSSISNEKTKEILRFGFPGPVSDKLYRNAYVGAYDRRTRNAHWVIYS